MAIGAISGSSKIQLSPPPASSNGLSSLKEEATETKAVRQQEASQGDQKEVRSLAKEELSTAIETSLSDGDAAAAAKGNGLSVNVAA